MTPTTAVRRFELRVPDAHDLADVESALKRASKKESIGPPTIERVEQPPLLDVRLEGPPSAVSGVMASIAKVRGARIRNDILKVRLNESGTRGRGPNTPVYPDLNALARIGADSLPRTRGSEPVTVAIVDSGLMVAHPDFRDHLWEGPDGIHGKQFIDGNPETDIHDQDGHGTLQAGTALAAAVDTPVKFMTAKFFDAANPTRPDRAAKALDFVRHHKARIILLAWDVGLGSADLAHAFREACKEALVVIAAGNYGSDNDFHDGRTTARAPARYAKSNPNTLVVMATDETSKKAWFSNYGKETVDLGAPGLGIMSTRRCLSKEAAAEDNNRDSRAYRVHSGTSAAAAHVAGAAALLMSRYPGLNAQQVKECLVKSVNKQPPLTCASGGRLDIGAALRYGATLHHTAKKPRRSTTPRGRSDQN